MAAREEHFLSVLTESNFHKAVTSSYISHMLWAQWHTVPLPAPNFFAGQTIIVTGANVGLGLEAVRNFTRLGAARVVVACRSIEKSEAAIKDVRASLPEAATQFVPMDVELGSFASVAAFAKRCAAELDRVDAVVENAGLATGVYSTLEGHESTITVNVLSTFYMALLLLPLLRRTAAQHNVRPRLSIVSSEAYLFARFREQKEPNIFAAMQSPASMNHDRYNVSKLLELLLVRELATVFTEHSIPVTLNTLNPGMCRTQLFRSLPFGVRHIVSGFLHVIGRSSDMGSRTLVAAAAAGPETHGEYMDTAQVWRVSEYVTSKEGAEAQKRLLAEILEIFEGLQPGISKNLD